MVFLFYFGLALLPILWIITIYLLRKWKYVKIFCCVNTLVVAINFVLIFHSTFHFFKTDPLGLKTIFLFLYLMIFQTVMNFIFSLYYKYKHK